MSWRQSLRRMLWQKHNIADTNVKELFSDCCEASQQCNYYWCSYIFTATQTIGKDSAKYLFRLLRVMFDRHNKTKYIVVLNYCCNSTVGHLTCIFVTQLCLNVHHLLWNLGVKFFINRLNYLRTGFVILFSVLKWLATN